MSELEDAVERFVREADTVYDEYENGYMDADAALGRIETHLDALREQVEE